MQKYKNKYKNICMTHMAVCSSMRKGWCVLVQQQVKSSQVLFFYFISQITNLPEGALHDNLYNIQHPLSLDPCNEQGKTPKKTLNTVVASLLKVC